VQGPSAPVPVPRSRSRRTRACSPCTTQPLRAGTPPSNRPATLCRGPTRSLSCCSRLGPGACQLEVSIWSRVTELNPPTPDPLPAGRAAWTSWATPPCTSLRTTATSRQAEGCAWATGPQPRPASPACAHCHFVTLRGLRLKWCLCLQVMNQLLEHLTKNRVLLERTLAWQDAEIKWVAMSSICGMGGARPLQLFSNCLMKPMSANC
jgi:hypothetical protein